MQENICRTCLMENAAMKSILDPNNLACEEFSLLNILKIIVPLQMVNGDGLPNQICLNCIQELNRICKFKQLCEKSDAILRNRMKLDKSLYESNKNELYDKDIPSAFGGNCGMDESECVSLVVQWEDKIKNEETCHTSDLDCEPIVQWIDKTKSEDNASRISRIPNIKKKYNCELCDETCLGLGSYRRHKIKHDRHFKCEICGKEYKSEVSLSHHLKAHSEPTKMRVALQTQKKKFNNTGVVKTRNLPRTCTICNKTFRFHNNLERHKLIHTGEKPFLCNVCGKSFTQHSYLKIHSFKHTGERPYVCRTCGRSFNAPGILMTHARTHTGERPHVCKVCGKDFSQTGSLTIHIRTHTGEKPVECKVCHRRFHHSGRLIPHMRMHSGEKPYTCKECGRSFAANSTLKKHVRTHTGERPYVCSTCGQAFAQSGTLATHMKVHRPKQRD